MMLNDVTKEIFKTAAGVAIGMATVVAVDRAIDAIYIAYKNKNKKKNTVTVEVEEPNTQEAKKEEKKEESTK